LPKFGRGRPSQANRRLAARKKRIEKKITDLFEHRHLLVQHHLTAAQEKTLRRITRGLPALRTLRQIMDEAYRLFDRRCRTDTALAKLARLRRRVARFKGLRQTLGKLFSPNLEKALTFLDDSLLPATSNAVERGNRRHRKMQKTVYRVRTALHISQRIAADMLRDAQAEGRLQTTHTLHLARAGWHVPGNGATVSRKPAFKPSSQTLKLPLTAENARLYGCYNVAEGLLTIERVIARSRLKPRRGSGWQPV
jgi:hypothetical protein